MSGSVFCGPRVLPCCTGGAVWTWDKEVLETHQRTAVWMAEHLLRGEGLAATYEQGRLQSAAVVGCVNATLTSPSPRLFTCIGWRKWL